MASPLQREIGSWRARRSRSEDFRKSPENRYFQPIYKRLYFQVTHIYVELYNLYLSQRKLYISNIQPIYYTVQHIFSDTTYILVFNIFVTLGVPYPIISASCLVFFRPPKPSGLGTRDEEKCKQLVKCPLLFHFLVFRLLGFETSTILSEHRTED